MKPQQADFLPYEINPLDSLAWRRRRRPLNVCYMQAATWMFKDIFSNPKNVCFVFPNKSRDNVIVRISRDKPAVAMTADQFIKEFVNHVFIKLFDFDNERNLISWLSSNFISFSDPWDGLYPDRMTSINMDGKKIKSEPDFMIHMRKAVRQFKIMQTDKKRLEYTIIHQHADAIRPNGTQAIPRPMET
jgi:hypothetical protein